jgi:hypothetical protein
MIAAEALFEQAIALDPDFARAHAELAHLRRRDEVLEVLAGTAATNGYPPLRVLCGRRRTQPVDRRLARSGLS